MANLFHVIHISDRIILLKLAIGKDIYTIISVHAPQFGLTDAEKDNFYEELHPVIAEIPTSENSFS